ncbi:MAG: DNA/RNA nuclease SfsA [Blastochloris viridis]|uniref:Sugar fermentation stimulation protein homolog n=1 Tax=Blastochloris viridis TaxID=1079 RepID=A0A6N4RDR9_BLAVI|nr:MAG: DNA/RNA nuclease SfsA [Blastochloris viridis]
MTHTSTYTLPFATPLVRWDFGRREKRFFMYGCEEGQIAHCPNTGSMMGLLDAKAVWVTPYPVESGRKLLFGAEMMEMADGTLVGINTHLPNKLAAGAIAAGLVTGLSGDIKIEVKFDAKTRFDLKVGETWVEVKNVTLAEGDVALFPDAKTERGAKHLRELQGIVEAGGSALQVYMVQRADCTTFKPAEQIDPVYAAALRSAMAAGVKAVALGCTLTKHGITVDRTLPVVV